MSQGQGQGKGPPAGKGKPDGAGPPVRPENSQTAIYGQCGHGQHCGYCSYCDNPRVSK